MWNKIKKLWNDPNKRDNLIIIVIFGILFVVAMICVIIWLAKVIIPKLIPVLIILGVIIFLCWDKLYDNWQYNKQRQIMINQRQCVEREAIYYRILDDVILPVLQNVCGESIYPDLIVYMGPYFYGDGPLGPIYYYRMPIFDIATLKSKKKNEISARIKRRLSQVTGKTLAEVSGYVKIKPGQDGVPLILICFNESI